MLKEYFKTPFYEIDSIDEESLVLFVEKTFLDELIDKAKPEILFNSLLWSVLTVKQRLDFLHNLHSKLFANCFPVAKLSVISSSSYIGAFYPWLWEIKFEESSFATANFDYCFGVWLHESFHAFLNFMSLCSHNKATNLILKPPTTINHTAQQLIILPTNQPAYDIARRNLIGHYGMLGFSKDSHYINVEIMVDYLAELLFKRFLPQRAYLKGYAYCKDYLSKRKRDTSPELAIQPRNWIITFNLESMKTIINLPQEDGSIKETHISLEDLSSLATGDFTQ